MMKISQLLSCFVLAVFLMGCASGPNPSESEKPSEIQSTDENTSADTITSTEETSQHTDDQRKVIRAVLYAFQRTDGNRTFMLDQDGTPILLRDIPPGLNDRLQNNFFSGTWVDAYYEKDMYESYPAGLFPVDVVDAGLAYRTIDPGFLQMTAGLGWKTVVGIIGEEPFLLMTLDDKTLLYSNAPLEFTYDDPCSVTMNYILPKEEGEVRIPLVTYILKPEPVIIEEADELEQGYNIVREITLNLGNKDEHTYYLYASFERYACRFLTEDFSFSKDFRTGSEDQSRDDITLTAEELWKIVDVQEGCVDGIDWTVMREAYQKGDLETVRQALTFTDLFLGRLGQERVWIAGYDNFLNGDTYNPTFPDMNQMDDKVNYPPELKILYQDQEIEAIRLTYTWGAVEADADHSLQVPKEMVNCIMLDGTDYEAELSFRIQPYQVYVRCWPEESAQKVEEDMDALDRFINEYTELPVEANRVTIPANGNYRFEVYANWYRGSCYYAFETINALTDK